VCSSNRVHSRGYRIAKSRRSVRYQCQACGSWFQGKSEVVEPLNKKKKNG
jgi:transposase-like protein